jgi:hypothetical protein
LADFTINTPGFKVFGTHRDERSVRLSGIAVLAARKAVAALGAGGTRKMPPQQTYTRFHMN